MSEVHLLGTPGVRDGGRWVDPPAGSHRFLAFLALGPARAQRRVVAGTLWPEVTDARAAANLRSAAWRLRGAGIDVVEADARALWLRAGTSVDVRAVDAWAGRLLDGDPLAADLAPPVRPQDADALLAGCLDHWAVAARERLRERVTHGWEACSRHLLSLGRVAAAEAAAAVVVAGDPCRESARRVLVEAHLAARRYDAARRTFDDYAELVRRGFRLGPSPGFLRLMEAVPAG